MGLGFKVYSSEISSSRDIDEEFLTGASISKLAGPKLITVGLNTNGELGVNNTSVNSTSIPNIISPDKEWRVVNQSNTSGMAIDSYNRLWAWGSNANGQIAMTASSTIYSSPVQIGALTNWRSVSVGVSHSSATKTDNTLWTWGKNSFGELGTSNFVDSGVPVQVGTASEWLMTTTGLNYTLAIKLDGTLWGWGENFCGILGQNTYAKFSSPIQIGSLNTWKSVHAGRYHALAITSTGSVYAWGSNSVGQLGYTTSGYMLARTSSPIQVGSLTSWSTVGYNTTILHPKLGYTTFFIDSTNKLFSSGINSSTFPTTSDIRGLGMLNKNISSPIQVGSLSNWKQVSATMFALAIKTDGTLWSSGDNGSGQLGQNTTISTSTFVQVGTLTNWASVCTLFDTAAAVKTDNTLWTWGNNTYGQLGYATSVRYSSPVQIGALTNWKQVSGGLYHLMAVKTDGTLWGLGWNTSGQLGRGVSTNYSSPIQIGALTNWKQVACGNSYTLATKTDGTLWAWGNNSSGQLGNSITTSYSSPIQIGSLTDWGFVAASSSTSYAIKTDGTLWAWGSNSYGQLGNSTTINYSSPIQVGSLTNWTQVAGAEDNVVAYTSSGTIFSWGRNLYGELGYSTYTSSGLVDSSTPSLIVDSDNYTYITAIGLSSFGIRNNNSLWGWGSGGNYMLARGVTTNASTPIQIGSSYTWKYLPNSNPIVPNTMSAIGTDGTLWSWGGNTYGQGFTISTGGTTDVTKASTKYLYNSISIGAFSAAAIGEYNYTL